MQRRVFMSFDIMLSGRLQMAGTKVRSTDAEKAAFLRSLFNNPQTGMFEALCLRDPESIVGNKDCGCMGSAGRRGVYPENAVSSWHASRGAYHGIDISILQALDMQLSNYRVFSCRLMV